LKYGPVLKVQSIEKNPDGSIKLVKVEALINLGRERGYVTYDEILRELGFSLEELTALRAKEVI
jgi:hypothetical protein